MTTKASPLVKWVGGKRQLLPQLEKHIPVSFNAYHEPFVGGGALFFHLRNLGRLAGKEVYLSDANERLIKTYVGIRDHAEYTIDLLKTHAEKHPLNPKSHFDYVRRLDVDNLCDAGVAAWFIYLNRTCFNGLYRVNRKGGFNVPIGDYENPTICDEENLRACSEALQGVHLRCADFRDSIAAAGHGDWLYADPPYVPLSATSSFTSYTRDKFTDKDQRDLAELAARAWGRGVEIVISNSNAQAVRQLYKCWVRHEVSARRNVSCKGNGRGAVKELIITGPEK